MNSEFELEEAILTFDSEEEVAEFTELMDRIKCRWGSGRPFEQVDFDRREEAVHVCVESCDPYLMRGSISFYEIERHSFDDISDENFMCPFNEFKRRFGDLDFDSSSLCSLL